jgi:hypothetical protein
MDVISGVAEPISTYIWSFSAYYKGIVKKPYTTRCSTFKEGKKSEGND